MSNRKSHAKRHSKKPGRMLADHFARTGLPVYLAPPEPKPGDRKVFAGSTRKDGPKWR